MGDRQRPIADVGVPASPHCRHRAHPEEARAHGDPDVDLADQARGDGRAEDREHPDPRDDIAGIGGGIAQHLLQPQWRQHDRREEGAKADRDRQRRHGKAAVAKDAKVDDRILLGQFPDDEDRKADRGNDREADDPCRSEPVILAPRVEHDLERADRKHQQHQPDIVDALALDRGFKGRDQPVDEEQADGDDRQVDEEDPRPAPIVADQAAEDRPEDRGGGGGHRPDREADRRALARKDAQQQGLRQRHQRAAGKALRHTEGDEHR